jgi:anti-sigma factor RsiW
MDCRRIETLIPLYVEGDLGREQADRVRSHLSRCGACALVAAEYEASQAWLRSYAPPEFDDAFYGEMRGAVMAGIEEEKDRRGFFQLFAPRLNARLVFASTAALLVVAAALAFYASRGPSGPVKQAEEMASSTTGEAETAATAQGGVIQATDEKPALKNHSTPGSAATSSVPRHSRRKKETVENVVTNPRENEAALSANVPSAEGPLRIEIQTADPTVRIIWIASKTDESRP